MIFFNKNSDINIDNVYTSSIASTDKFKTSNYIYAEEINENNIYRISENPQPSKPQSELSSIYKRETRAHAFYRILGLPITDGTNFFNPGFDPDPANDPAKIEISNKYLKSDTCKKNNIYQKIFDRTNYVVDVFNNNDITSSTMILSLMSDRKFADYIIDPSIDPLLLSEDNCKYTVDLTDQRQKSYKEYYYVDEGSVPNYPPGLGESRNKFILPLIPDPKICFCINKSSQVYVPFFILKGANSEPEFRFPAAGLDKIFQDRFSKATTEENLTDTEKEISDTISKFSSIFKQKKYSASDIDDINKSSNLFIEQKNKFYFNFIKFSKSLLKILKENIKTARAEQIKYNILPTTTISGPEEGVSARPIYALNKNNTEADKNIIIETQKSISANISSIFKVVDSKPVVNKTNAIASVASPVADTVKSDDKLETLESLNNKRNKSVANMCNSLKYIEYLVGEFSGFGIIDMYVVTSALYLIEPGVLASFLDDNAYERAKSPEFNINLPERTVSVIDAYKKLAETIRTLYLTLDTLYLSIE